MKNDLPKSGIYAIKNTVNGKVYVGSAVNLRQRFISHRSCLKKGTHHSLKLQRAWDKYGSETFVFEVIESVSDKQNLIKCEQYWIDEMVAAGEHTGYNILPVAGSPLGIKCSPETIAKMSESHKGKIFSQEHRNQLSKSATGRKMSIESIAKAVLGRSGRIITDESRAKMSVARIGKTWSAETRVKMEARVISDKTREKMRIAATGRKMSREAVEKTAAANRGRKASIETRRKMSLAVKRRLPISEETRARIVVAAKQREAARKAIV